MCKYQEKGSLIGIDGTLRTDTYEVEGKKRRKTYVLVNTLDFLGKKEEKEANEFSQISEHVEFQAGQQIEISDEDLPW